MATIASLPQCHLLVSTNIEEFQTVCCRKYVTYNILDLAFKKSIISFQSIISKRRESSALSKFQSKVDFRPFLPNIQISSYSWHPLAPASQDSRASVWLSVQPPLLASSWSCPSPQSLVLPNYFFFLFLSQNSFSPKGDPELGSLPIVYLSIFIIKKETKEGFVRISLHFFLFVLILIFFT